MSKTLCTLVVALSLLVGCRPQPVVPDTRPNLLLLVIDCLRADHLSSSGYPRPTTPTLDRLAAEGTSFTRAYSQASWTRPSLPTILSGLYPSEHGLLSFEGETGDIAGAAVAPAVELVSETVAARGWATALVGEQFQLAPRFGLDQGFDLYRHKTSGAVNIHRHFLGWLGEQSDPARPWFAYLHYLEIHWPYCPPKETRGTFDPGRSQIDFCHEWRQLRDDIHSGRRVLSADDVETMRARYDEELLGLDRRIAELLAELEARGELDETLIVVTADHGEEFMERGGIGHGQSLHEELTAVPLVVRPPRSWQAPTARRVDHVVELRTVAPTFAHAAGRPPGASGPPSLLPWVLGHRDGPIQPFALAESVEDIALRTDQWTLLARKDGSAASLHSRLEDPDERIDVASSHRRELAELRALAAGWREALEPITNAGAATALDAETEQGLRALGYLGGGEGDPTQAGRRQAAEPGTRNDPDVPGGEGTDEESPR